MTDARDDSNATLAWKSPAAVTLFLMITLGALFGDLWSKHEVFERLLTAPRTPTIEHRITEARARLVHNGVEENSANILRVMKLTHEYPLGIRLTLSTNPGVVFGLPMPRWLVVVTTIVTVIALSAFFAFSPAGHRWLHIGKALILAGALGNLYDRMATTVYLPGLEPISQQVRDFLDFSAWGYPWIFNVADVWLVVGVAMVMLYWWLHPDHRKAKAPSQS